MDKNAFKIVGKGSFLTFASWLHYLQRIDLTIFLDCKVSYSEIYLIKSKMVSFLIHYWFRTFSCNGQLFPTIINWWHRINHFCSMRECPSKTTHKQKNKIYFLAKILNSGLPNSAVLSRIQWTEYRSLTCGGSGKRRTHAFHFFSYQF
jgi:hypothetical protein